MDEAEWKRLLEDLRCDPDDARWIAAWNALQGATDRSRIPDLLRLLDDDDFAVRERAATPLIAMEGLRILPALLRALERGEEDGHDNDSLASEIVALVEVNATDVAPMLLEMLESGEPKERADAARLLEFVANEITLAPLIKASRDPEPRVRRAAIGALDSFRGEPEVLKVVLALLEDPDEGVRADAALALGSLGGPRALPALRRVLENPSVDSPVESRPKSVSQRLQSNVASVVVLPIAGILSGLALGLARAWVQRMDELGSLYIIVRWGVLGFFLGLGSTLLAATGASNLKSVRGLAWLIVVVAFMLAVWTLIP